MNCQTVRTFLQVYLDGEFDAGERQEVEGHLAGCEACRHQAEYERRFREAVRARIPLEEAPTDLRERMEALVASPPAAAPSRFSRRLMWSSVPAVAALALVITFTWTVTSGFSPLVDDAVTRHNAEPPVEVESRDRAEVEHWFRSKVDFNVALPRFTQAHLHLEGARLSNLAERQAALVRYRLGNRRVSLFVIAGQGVEPSGERCQRLERWDVCLSDVRGFTVMTWRSRGLVYSMVGDTPGEDLIRVLSDSR